MKLVEIVNEIKNSKIAPKPWNRKYYEYCVTTAKYEKQLWAGKMKDSAWMAKAGGMALDAAKEYTSSSIKQLADKAYVYGYLRSHTKSKATQMPIDKEAAKRWEDITGEDPMNNPLDY